MGLSSINEAIEDIKAGRFVIIVDDEDRENEGDLALAAEKVTPQAINFMAQHARGLICLSITGKSLDKLGIPLMVNDNTSKFSTAFTVSEEDMDNMFTPGALEIPLIALKLARTKRYNAIICLGAVICGGTPHFNYVATELSKGIARIALETGLPIINGVITADTLEQTIERAGTKMGNKGFIAASNAIEMANLLKSLGIMKERTTANAEHRAEKHM